MIKIEGSRFRLLVGKDAKNTHGTAKKNAHNSAMVNSNSTTIMFAILWDQTKVTDSFLFSLFLSSQYCPEVFLLFTT